MGNFFVVYFLVFFKYLYHEVVSQNFMVSAKSVVEYAIGIRIECSFQLPSVSTHFNSIYNLRLA